MKKKWSFFIIILISLGVIANNDDRYSDLKIFAKVLNLIERHYIEPIEIKHLIYGAIKGMLRELDPHSAYLTSEKYKEFENESKGEFGGIGIEIAIDQGYLTVVSPIEDTPAFQAGIKSKDRIVAINGKSTKGFTLIEASQHLKGKIGEKITLSIQRNEEKPFDVTIVRSRIKIKSVKAKVFDENYLYIKITKFIETTSNDVEKILQKHHTSKAPISGLILDLRGNPGGLLDQAIKISDLFIPEDKIIFITKTRQQSETRESKTSNRLKYLNFPLVVLIDSGSASASEIVAGAIQDHKRGLIMGQKSFGKGSVQSIINLEDGSALKLTIARYYTPHGRSIQAQGIEPDLWINTDWDLSNLNKTQKKKNVFREKDLNHHLKADGSQNQKSLLDEPWFDNDWVLVQAINYIKVLSYGKENKGSFSYE